MPTDKIKSSELIPPDELRIIEHSQWLEKWKNVSAMVLVAVGFLVICLIVVLPYVELDPFRDKAWTLFTVLISGASAYLYSSKDDND